MIEIANVRDLPPVAEWDPWMVYVGRRNNRRGLKASPLANPWRDGDVHPIAIGTMSSDELISEYRAELTHWLSTRRVRFHWSRYPPPLRGHTGIAPEYAAKELDRLRALHEKHGKLVLVCWCAPKPCHAEYIKEVLEAGS